MIIHIAIIASIYYHADAIKERLQFIDDRMSLREFLITGSVYVIWHAIKNCGAVFCFGPALRRGVMPVTLSVHHP